MTLPESYPNLSRLLAEFFTTGSNAKAPARVHRDMIRAFGLTEPPECVDEVVGDALLILNDSARLQDFEQAMNELGMDFERFRTGLTARTWLATVVELLSREG